MGLVGILWGMMPVRHTGSENGPPLQSHTIQSLPELAPTIPETTGSPHELLKKSCTVGPGWVQPADFSARHELRRARPPGVGRTGRVHPSKLVPYGERCSAQERWHLWVV